MVELAVRAAAAVVRGAPTLREWHVVASPKLPLYQKLRWTRSNVYFLNPSHSAPLYGFAEFAELSNREELYRWEKWRQYRIPRRNPLSYKCLAQNIRNNRKISQPAEPRRSPHPTQRA